jgi:peroxiredoxin
MKHLRYWVVILGLIALVALFLKLPDTPNLPGVLHCKTCVSSDPYIPLMGAGYFALLVAFALLFPSLPGPRVARAGLTWAILLALALTYLHFPQWCALCLIAHACNILIWTIWMIDPAPKNVQRGSPLRERLCLVLFAPISVIALFGALDLTFMAYGFKISHSMPMMGVQKGETVPVFSAQTSKGRSISNTNIAQTKGVVLSFVLPGCPHCKHQLPIVNAVAVEMKGSPYRFINISPTLQTGEIQLAPDEEWVEDKDGKLGDLFKISGYPTMFIIKPDGKIAEVIPGAPEQFSKDSLIKMLES